MKTISLGMHIGIFRKGTAGVRSVLLQSILLLGVATALPTACDPDLSCAETATCPPNEMDGGQDAQGRGRDGLTDNQEPGDAAGASADVRADTDRDAPATSDSRSPDSALADRRPDGLAGDDVAETGRADVSTDNRTVDVSMDLPGGDISIADSPGTTDGGGVDDVQHTDTSDAANDTSDAGGSIDVGIACNANTCPTGCCNASHQCVTPSAATCGSGGAMCQACSAGQVCNGASCGCTPSSCPTGCCNGDRCVPFAEQNDDQCGAASACTSCTATMQTCNKSNGQCVCPAGQLACGGTCCAAGQGCCNNACTPLDTPSNCGVCGNACVTGKVCSGTQCLWEDGRVCASGADCASGVCGGRCCPAGTSCTCTQPGPHNLLQNPGFDVGLTGWNVQAGPGEISWQPRGPVDQWNYSWDAENCPYSGGAKLTCNKGEPCGDQSCACQWMWQCIDLPYEGEFTFGKKLSNDNDQPGETHCAVATFTGLGCTGTSTLRIDQEWINIGWSGFIPQVFETGSDRSARVYCYRAGSGTGRVDMLYLTGTREGGGY
jgi:hypothetical protein